MARVKYLSDQELNVAIQNMLDEINEDASGPIKDSSSSGKYFSTLLYYICENMGLSFLYVFFLELYGS